MARKRKIPPNPEMVRLLEKRKAQQDEFEREMKALEAKQQTRWVELGQLAEACGIASLADNELREEFERIAQQRGMPKAA